MGRHPRAGLDEGLASGAWPYSRGEQASLFAGEFPALQGAEQAISAASKVWVPLVSGRPRHRSTAPPIDYAAQRLPHAEATATSTVWLYHPMLLAEPEDVLDIARAMERIQLHAGEVAKRVRWDDRAKAGRRVAGRLRRRLGRRPWSVIPTPN